MGSLRFLTRQSGVVPWRWSADGVEVLLVTNRGGRRWLVPKGNVERRLSPAAQAAREAFEEAGVVGVVDPEPLGSFVCGRGKKGTRRWVELFGLTVTEAYDVWPEMQARRRMWVPPDAAAERVAFGDLAACIVTLARRLRCGVAA